MRRDSLRLRLGLAAAALIALALVLAGIGLTVILDRVLDARTVAELDRTAKLIAGRVGLAPDGAPTLSRDLPDPRFATPYGGLYWQVEAGSHLLRSRSLWDKSLDLGQAGAAAQAPATLDTTGPDGGRLIAVVRPLQIGAPGAETALRVAVAEDRRGLAASRTTFLRLLVPALVALFVREGDGAGAAIFSPAAGRVRRRSKGDSRLPCYGDGTIRCLDYGTAVCGGEDPFSFRNVLNLFIVLLRHRYAVKRRLQRRTVFLRPRHRLERGKALRSTHVSLASLYSALRLQLSILTALAASAQNNRVQS